MTLVAGLTKQQCQECFAYGAAVGVCGAVVIMLACIAIGERVARWRRRRRFRGRPYS